jgi:hypothetical protein
VVQRLVLNIIFAHQATWALVVLHRGLVHNVVQRSFTIRLFMLMMLRQPPRQPRRILCFRTLGLRQQRLLLLNLLRMQLVYGIIRVLLVVQEEVLRQCLAHSVVQRWHITKHTITSS